ncbi:MAG: dimethyladenosine transferase [Frankiales bacterium]|nr:dimethyladenosine transferase [Frankiales bacterium]
MPLVPDRTTVQRVVPAPPAAVFALLADPSRHHELDGSGLISGTDEPSRQLALGDTFGMAMKAGPVPYAMVNTVVELEPDARIAWQPRPVPAWLRPFIGGRIWRYELEPAEGGTLVRETWDISQEQVKPLVWPLARATRTGMQRSLDRLADLVGGRS